MRIGALDLFSASVHYLLHTRSNEKARWRDGEIRFFPRLMVRILFYVGTPFYLWGSIAAATGQAPEWGVACGFAAMFALNLYIWPGVAWSSTRMDSAFTMSWIFCE